MRHSVSSGNFSGSQGMGLDHAAQNYGEWGHLDGDRRDTHGNNYGRSQGSGHGSDGYRGDSRSDMGGGSSRGYDGDSRDGMGGDSDGDHGW